MSSAQPATAPAAGLLHGMAGEGATEPPTSTTSHRVYSGSSASASSTTNTSTPYGRPVQGGRPSRQAGQGRVKAEGKGGRA